jgi:hypothetical protein
MFSCNILCAWFCTALLVYSACLCNGSECGKPLGEGNTSEVRERLSLASHQPPVTTRSPDP